MNVREQFFLSTKGPAPVLWCTRCHRHVRLAQLSDQAKARDLHVCGPPDGLWSR